MKKTNIIIFIVVILLGLAIFGYVIWGENLGLKGTNNNQNQNGNQITNSENVNNDVYNNEQINEIQTNTMQNEQSNENTVNTNETNTQTNVNEINNNGGGSENNNSNYYNYVGDWFISEQAYRNAEEIEHVLDMWEDRLISQEEFESKMSSDMNSEVAELDVDRFTENQIRFDFNLTSPAPSQREADIDNVVVDLDRGVGTFTYTDNWGNRGNGTISLKENQIELRLETTSAAQGAQWGVEGIYTFSYKRID